MADATDVDVVVIGAGAAGIGAAKTLAKSDRTFIVLEASHRIGGRGYTEEVVPGMPFDLGCHWMHSGSRNPFVQIADEMGMTYSKQGFPRSDGCHDGEWYAPEELADFDDFYDRQEAAIAEKAAAGRECSVWDATEREHRWTAIYDYILSINSSHDPDELSIRDHIAYADTEENWPLKQGFGTLLYEYGADLPVTLNSAVTEIDWSGANIRLTTPKGTIRARRIILTVSNGILAAGDVRFKPGLPDWKHDAVAGLPIGNHNRICLAFDRDVFGPDAPRGFMSHVTGSEPMAFNLRPFGYNYVVGLTGGRFADWLERAGQEASVDLAEQHLKAAFGSDITRHMSANIVTAWRGDPWVKGAYSCALPGQAHQRRELAKPVGERIHFAGEATSPEFFSTAHGAYLSGVRAADEVISAKVTS